MKVLLVEDTPATVEELRSTFADDPVELRVAESRDGALEALEEGGFDLAICDLKMPARDGGVDLDTEHGLAVCDHIRDTIPGLPVVILSGFGHLDDLDTRLSEAQTVDLLGTGQRPMLKHFRKTQMTDFVAYVRRHAEELEALHDIEISGGAEQVDLGPHDRQVLRIYARRLNGAVVSVRRLSGGRSGAVTLAAEIDRLDGTRAGRVVAKLNTLDEVADEVARYVVHVPSLLNPGTFTPYADEVIAGAGSRSGVFYSLAVGFDESLFDLVAASPSDAQEVVQRVREALEPWHGRPHADRVTVADVRRLLVTDEVFSDLASRYDWARDEVEAQEVWVNMCDSHGDLHGGNLLINAAKQSLLIDFGRVGTATAALDPITLELSAVLHPDAGGDLGGWPTQAQAEVWDSAEYVDPSPIKPFVEACREWLYSVARGNREVDATIYAYALRQLRFDDVDWDLASAFGKGAAGRLMAPP